MLPCPPNCGSMLPADGNVNVTENTPIGLGFNVANSVGIQRMWNPLASCVLTPNASVVAAKPHAPLMVTFAPTGPESGCNLNVPAIGGGCGTNGGGAAALDAAVAVVSDSATATTRSATRIRTGSARR